MDKNTTSEGLAPEPMMSAVAHPYSILVSDLWPTWLPKVKIIQPFQPFFVVASE